MELQALTSVTSVITLTEVGSEYLIASIASPLRNKKRSIMAPLRWVSCGKKSKDQPCKPNCFSLRCKC